jgi:hypothetical protein
MRNYKKIRQTPYIYGFSIIGFFTFAIGAIIGLLAFMGGFSLLKLILVSIYMVVLFVVSKLVLSNKTFIAKMTDNVLPKKYSEYE